MMVSMSHVEIKQLIFHDIAHFGVRLVVGLIFILHSTGKFQDWFLEFLASQGIPVETTDTNCTGRTSTWNIPNHRGTL